MKAANIRISPLLLAFSLCGFALAEPVYDLLLRTPAFLVARQNTPADVWALTGCLSVLLPFLAALPAWLGRRRWPRFARGWSWGFGSVFAALFFAQLLQPWLGGHALLFLVFAGLSGVAAAWLLVYSRWSVLAAVLALGALYFALRFLWFSPVSMQSDHFTALASAHNAPHKRLPDIVFVILDELPVATLEDGRGHIDAALFPGFARLESMANWYYNTTTVSDGTVDAVPSILTGHYPREQASDLTVAAQPVNLFTLLGRRYHFNVAEAVTRMCPRSLCPRAGPPALQRFKALLLDMSAVYLHRVLPQRWTARLPDVSNNWSGFFAAPQVFFPQGWLKFAGQQTVIDRPAYFRRFIDSVRKRAAPTLNFMHTLFPHGPHAYLPNGENYGLEWMRGQVDDQWGDVEWALVSGNQRHYLQTQYADRLLAELLDRLQQQGMLKEAMIVVVTDHGISFKANERRRALSSDNEAAMLRVPLFIKFPGQLEPRRIGTRAQTIDILPTVLSALGLSYDALHPDGSDLRTLPASTRRPRRASSYLQREVRTLDESRLDIVPLVAVNRRQLKLDEPAGALWAIGPYDGHRGQPLETVCRPLTADIAADFDTFRPLPGASPDRTVRAYVAGHFSGKEAPADSQPFLISDRGRVVASGYTWSFNSQPQFFALVEPRFVKRAGWSPRAWLLRGTDCLGH